MKLKTILYKGGLDMFLKRCTLLFMKKFELDKEAEKVYGSSDEENVERLINLHLHTDGIKAGWIGNVEAMIIGKYETLWVYKVLISFDNNKSYKNFVKDCAEKMPERMVTRFKKRKIFKEAKKEAKRNMGCLKFVI